VRVGRERVPTVMLDIVLVEGEGVYVGSGNLVKSVDILIFSYRNVVLNLPCRQL
jgi:hypothetical protein